MIEYIDLLFLFAAGVVGGVVTGMLGIGGGIIYVVIFSTFLQADAKAAIDSDILVKLIIANSLFSIAFAGIAGTIKQIRISNFFLRPVLLIGIPGVIATMATTFLLSKTTIYSKEVFAIVFSLLVLPILVKMLFFKTKEGIEKEEIPSSKLSLTGILSGTAAALSGLGGGFIIVPVLNGLFGVPIRKTVSISIGVITLVTVGLSLFNLFAFNYSTLEIPWLVGSISMAMVLPVILGVLLGSPLGVNIAHKVQPQLIRILFASFCLLVILRTLIIYL